MKVKEIVKIIEREGRYLKRTKGSHRQYKHNEKKSLVTVSGHFNDDIAIGTLRNIFKQAGSKYE